MPSPRKAVEHQIKMNLFQNTRVFDVLQGSRKWSVDTTSDDGWVMVNADGKRRAMKYQAQPIPAAEWRGSGEGLKRAQ